jgi:predicted Zn-dependent peptidase
MRRILIPFLILLASPPRTGHAQNPSDPLGVSLPVRDVTLENGMRVLVLPRTGAPTVAFVVQYAVGSVNERLGTTGIAHLLEHLLFKGTTTVGTRDIDAERRLFLRMDAAHDTLLLSRAELRPDSLELRRLEDRIRSLEDSARVHVESNEFDRILSRQGARGLNATTSTEATTYFVQLPANRVELWFALEADRMRNPVFREFYTERDVVMEERRTRVEDSPSGRLYEAHLATAYLAHPYGVPVVGWMSDLEQLSRADVEEYYRRFYGPDNAVVAIVGDIDPEQVVAWAEEYLGSVLRGERPPSLLVREPAQRGERRIEVEFDAAPLLRIGWHVPDVRHEDAPALAMLSTLLTGGRTSRLYRRLVLEERVAASASASMGPGDVHPRLFQIDAAPRAPHTPAEVEALIYEELDLLMASPPTDEELQRVRNQLQAGEVRRLDSNLGLAFQLAGSAALFDDWRETFRLGRRLQEVGPGDVQRVVRRYFSAENRTVATLVRPRTPEPGAP